MDLNLAALRQSTINARTDAIRAKELAAQAAEEKAQQEILRQQARAGEVVALIPSIAETSASQGHGYAIIMEIGNDYDHPLGEDWRVCKPEWLKGAAAMVYHYCKSQSLKPTIEAWDDGVGEKSGFNIVIHWM